MDDAEARAESDVILPPILRADHQTAPPLRGPWYRTIGLAYLGLFVWAPFFDSLWTCDLTKYSLPWLVSSAVIASALCLGLFYFIPAAWGFRTRQPLGILAASTFGTVGSEWITGVAVGVAAIFWYAVAIDYAVDSTLLGLCSCGLIGAESLAAWNLGPIVSKSPVYLTTAIFWIYITGTAGVWKMPGVIVALMKVYSPVALLLLAAVALWLAPNLRTYRIDDAWRVASAADSGTQLQGPVSVLQLMTGFFAMAGLASVDAGATLLRSRDLVVGGLVGVVLAASGTAIMSLVVVAGAVSRVVQQGESSLSSLDGPFRFSFRWAVYYGIGGVAGGAILILFGLAALAPACYATWVYGQKLSVHWPSLGPSGWTWTGGAIAFILGATSYANRLDWFFFAMGAFFAPAIGAMAGDWLQQRGAWAGPRPGVNRAGVIAWAAGFGIAVALEIARLESRGHGSLALHDTPWWYSTSIYGFIASFLCYSLLVRLRPELPAIPMDRWEIGP